LTNLSLAPARDQGGATAFTRRAILAGVAACAIVRPARASDLSPAAVVEAWYRLILELVRHTATYSPPVAARAFAYLGIAVWEATAAARGLKSLAGQLNQLPPLPAGEPGTYDEPVLLNAAILPATLTLFGNTGPTGQRALEAMSAKMSERVATGKPAALVERSRAHGAAIARHILDWAATDGGAVIQNMGFPLDYKLGTQPGAWVPTSTVGLQQWPLLPNWPNNRPLAMPDGRACALPPPTAYSEDPTSAFYAEAMEVYKVSKALTDEQKLIARFWSDDPMLSPTPPGHWVSIVLGIARDHSLDTPKVAEALARLGIAINDGFIACWQSKYQYDLLRPVTYIRRHIDPTWEPLLITPPFPEYPSGHSTQSGAAATALTATFGEAFAFADDTHVDEGMPVRRYPDFWTAAREAAQSRLYGGIHFRAANERGLEQGACVGAHAARLVFA
jgi:hypothetical protein